MDVPFTPIMGGDLCIQHGCLDKKRERESDGKESWTDEEWAGRCGATLAGWADGLGAVPGSCGVTYGCECGIGHERDD